MFDEEVRKYFTILCIPVSIAIIVLMCIPNLPKPAEQLSISGRMQRVRNDVAHTHTHTHTHSGSCYLFAWWQGLVPDQS